MRDKPLSFFDLPLMLMVEENHTSASRSMQWWQWTIRCCTQRQIGLVVMENAVDRHAMVAVDKSRIGAT